MSIVSEYQGLADFVVGFSIRNEPMPPRTAAILASNLLKLADQVKLLERLAVVHEPARAYADAE